MTQAAAGLLGPFPPPMPLKDGEVLCVGHDGLPKCTVGYRAAMQSRLQPTLDIHCQQAQQPLQLSGRE